MENKRFFDENTTKTIILGLIVGTALISILLILCAIMMSISVLPITAANVCSTLSLSIGAFLAGLFTAKRIRKKGLVTGLIVVGILFLIFTVISLIATLSAPTLLTLLKGVITAVSSGIGGILGVNMAAKRKLI